MFSCQLVDRSQLRQGRRYFTSNQLLTSAFTVIRTATLINQRIRARAGRGMIDAIVWDAVRWSGIICMYLGVESLHGVARRYAEVEALG